MIQVDPVRLVDELKSSYALRQWLVVDFSIVPSTILMAAKTWSFASKWFK